MDSLLSEYYKHTPFFIAALCPFAITYTCCSEPVVVYKMFKALATRLSIALFLSHHMSPENCREISGLMTLHWRGIISVPVSMRGPWSLWQSGYSKALTAKDRLRAIIAETIKSRPSLLVSDMLYTNPCYVSVPELLQVLKTAPLRTGRLDLDIWCFLCLLSSLRPLLH